MFLSPQLQNSEYPSLQTGLSTQCRRRRCTAPSTVGQHHAAEPFGNPKPRKTETCRTYILWDPFGWVKTCPRSQGSCARTSIWKAASHKAGGRTWAGHPRGAGNGNCLGRKTRTEDNGPSACIKWGIDVLLLTRDGRSERFLLGFGLRDRNLQGLRLEPRCAAFLETESL